MASASGGITFRRRRCVPVTIGLSNDTVTEISSGVNVGDQIIVQTINSTVTAASTRSGGTSTLRLLRAAARLGGGGGGGGGISGGGGAAIPYWTEMDEEYHRVHRYHGRRITRAALIPEC